MSSLAPQSRQAFHDLLDLLREIADTHFTPERGVIDEVTAVEGYRFLAHLLSAGCEHRIEGDPAGRIPLLGNHPREIEHA